ncbi:MAG TPA: hypothetical protein VJ911_08580, partial [Cryomorphaceae bacterium]|nr:hypothetical protein [Cryomorphaceae bacterium]
MKNIALTFSMVVGVSLLFAQESDSTQIRRIFDEALTRGQAYENLRELCKNVGNRLSGSEGAEKAVEWSVAKMESYGFDEVWLEPTMVPKWDRGAKEKCA